MRPVQLYQARVKPVPFTVFIVGKFVNDEHSAQAWLKLVQDDVLICGKLVSDEHPCQAC